MARRVTVQEATADDLQSLQYWHDLAGVVEAQPQQAVQALIAARQRGVLGIATTGKNLKDRWRVLAQLPREDWYWACTVVLALRLDELRIGMLQAGAHYRLWEFLHEAYHGPQSHDIVDPAELERREAAYLASILTMSKLHMVGVSPDQRGRGHGRRLINHLVNRLARGGTRLVYGQFGGDRDLRGFYESLGFEVLQRGEPLDMTVATGIPHFGLGAQPEDTFFALAMGA